MLVKNKETGETIGLDYDSAIAAVTAGTHSIVNVDEDGKPKPENAKVADAEDAGSETASGAEQPLPKDDPAASTSGKSGGKLSRR